MPRVVPIVVPVAVKAMDVLNPPLLTVTLNPGEALAPAGMMTLGGRVTKAEPVLIATAMPPAGAMA